MSAAPSSYFTITRPAEGLFRDRGSKFLAYAYPVNSEDDIKQCLLALRKEHPSARHHCYAWRLGPLNETSRANDDGEPSSSAGKPILMQLQANGLYQVLIVVVRYFGGTLLGVNGLMNAYREAAAGAIANAALIGRFVMSEYKLSFDAAEQGPVMRILKENEAIIVSNSYGTGQEIVFRVKKGAGPQVEKRFTALYKTRLEHIQTI